MELARKIWIQAALFKLQTPTYKNRIIGGTEFCVAVQYILILSPCKGSDVYCFIDSKYKKRVSNMLTRG